MIACKDRGALLIPPFFGLLLGVISTPGSGGESHIATIHVVTSRVL